MGKDLLYYDNLLGELPAIWHFLIVEGRKRWREDNYSPMSDEVELRERALLICKTLPRGDEILEEVDFTNRGLGLAYVEISIYGIQHLHEYLRAIKGIGKDNPTTRGEFINSIEDDAYAQALKEITDQIYGSEREATLDYLTEDYISDEHKEEALKYLGTFSPCELDEIHKSKARKAKRKNRAAPETSETIDLLKRHWLPLVLWNKQIAEIVASIPELSSGGTIEDHERDCDKVEKAIKRLNWSRRL
jgi:hypothetical protein